MAMELDHVEVFVASSSTAGIAEPRRPGPSPSVVAVADAPSIRRVAAAARGSPAPTRGACEPCFSVSQGQFPAIWPWPAK